MHHPKHVLLLFLLALGGAGYFGAFAAFDLHPVLQNQLALLPIQFGALVYFLWWRPYSNQKSAPETRQTPAKTGWK